mgnify:CR=1 FL=1
MMNTFIPQRLTNLIIIFSLFGVFTGCNASTKDHLDSYPIKKLSIDGKSTFKVYIADTNDRQRKGLSEINSNEFTVLEAMLFPATKMSVRQFWMPNTHFDLDVIFLNQDHFILDIHRGLKHYPKLGPKSKVPLSKEVYSKDVLEIRSDSPDAKKFKIGMQLKFI